MSDDAQESELYALLMRLKPASLTPNAWANMAGVSRQFFSDIKRGAKPRDETLEKALAAINMKLSEFQMIREGETPAAARRKSDPISAFRSPRANFDEPGASTRDLPVLGAALGADRRVEDDGRQSFAEVIELDLGEVVDHIRRPAVLSMRRDVYALYTVGISMEPRYRQGSILIIDPARPPRNGDDVVVQLARPRGDDDSQIYSVLIKTLARTGSDYVELEQYNPAISFRITRKEIAAIHRVMTLDELVGA